MGSFPDARAPLDLADRSGSAPVLWRSRSRFQLTCPMPLTTSLHAMERPPTHSANGNFIDWMLWPPVARGSRNGGMPFHHHSSNMPRNHFTLPCVRS